MLFPEPFSPMIACTSPRRSSSEQSRSAWVAPKDFASRATSRTTSTGGETWLSVSGVVGRGLVRHVSHYLSPAMSISAVVLRREPTTSPAPGAHAP